MVRKKYFENSHYLSIWVYEVWLKNNRIDAIQLILYLYNFEIIYFSILHFPVPTPFRSYTFSIDQSSTKILALLAFSQIPLLSVLLHKTIQNWFLQHSVSLKNKKKSYWSSEKWFNRGIPCLSKYVLTSSVVGDKALSWRIIHALLFSNSCCFFLTRSRKVVRVST